MPAAINPYSMAVDAVSSFANRMMMCSHVWILSALYGGDVGLADRNKAPLRGP